MLHATRSRCRYLDLSILFAVLFMLVAVGRGTRPKPQEEQHGGFVPAVPAELFSEVLFAR